jgi:predicted ArsR family transcriptional regulator
MRGHLSYIQDVKTRILVSLQARESVSDIELGTTLGLAPDLVRDALQKLRTQGNAKIVDYAKTRGRPRQLWALS